MRTLWRLGLAWLLLGTAGLAVLCFLGPAAAALAEILSAHQWAAATLGPRRIGLLLRGLLIAACSATLAQVLGAGLAAGLCAAGAPRLRASTAWVCALVLLTPPYIYTYAWNLVLLPSGATVGAEGALRWPAWLAHEGRAVWCLAAWTAPVGAAILAGGWRVSGRPAYALALPDATPRQALLHGAGPAMVPWVIVALIVAGLLALTEHTVCDLCQAPTWNTEILAQIQNRGGPGPLLAWPLVVLVGVFLLALWPFRTPLRRWWSEFGDLQTAAEALGSGGRHGRRLAFLAAALAAALVLLPWIILVAQLRDLDALRRMWVIFPREWRFGLLCAAGSALACAWLAIGCDSLWWLCRRFTTRWARAGVYILLALAALAAASPPALVGDAFAAAYLPWPLLSDHWPVVSLVTAARFTLIPMLALRLAGRSVASDLTGMAATDGAAASVAYFRVRLPLCLPTLLAASVVVGLLSLTEVPATYLVRPPGVESLALTLFNSIHYGRNDEIVAMSLYVMLLVGVLITAVQWAVTWRSSLRAPV